MLKGNFVIFNMLAKYVPGDIKLKEIIHGRHRVVQIYTWAGSLNPKFTPSDSEG
jgi:hypothetical protein